MGSNGTGDQISQTVPNLGLRYLYERGIRQQEIWRWDDGKICTWGQMP